MNAIQRRIRTRSIVRRSTKAWAQLATRDARTQARRQAVGLAGAVELANAAEALEPRDPGIDAIAMASPLTLEGWFVDPPDGPSRPVHLCQVSTPPSKAKPYGELLTIVHARGGEVARITTTTRSRHAHGHRRNR